MQSRVVHTLESEQHPEHTASSAAASKDHQPGLTAHEQTVQTEEHTHDQADLRLHHGKEAAEIAAKHKAEHSK